MELELELEKEQKQYLIIEEIYFDDSLSDVAAAAHHHSAYQEKKTTTSFPEVNIAATATAFAAATTTRCMESSGKNSNQVLTNIHHDRYPSIYILITCGLTRLRHKLPLANETKRSCTAAAIKQQLIRCLLHSKTISNDRSRWGLEIRSTTTIATTCEEREQRW